VCAQDRKRLEPGGLESPFLTGELFTDEAALKESSRVSALQAESPFLRAFEFFEAGSGSPVVPEVYAEEGELAGEAAEDISPELEDEVFTLPPSVPGLPTDATLRAQLWSIGTPEARALHAAFAVIGDPVKFPEKLKPALSAVFQGRELPEPRFRIHLSRLGAEAFILDTKTVRYELFYSYIDHPDQLDSAQTTADQQNFLQFAMQRLHWISPIVVNPATHRRQITRAAALLRFFQAELARGDTKIFAKNDLLAYRTLLVQIIWRHYQALQDLVLEAAAKAPLQQTFVNGKWETLLKNEWDSDLKTATITNLIGDDTPPLLPVFRLTPTLYRDYFKPSAASDIGFGYYHPKPSPLTGHGPEMPYRLVYQRRTEQRAFIERLWKEKGDHPIPKLHDTASWQAWVRQVWDSPLLRRETKLDEILKYLNGYFAAFTIPIPQDLREGCGVPSYLLRPFPRAVTGSLVHDCYVYAARWLHMLGRLFSSGSTPSDISNPRIFFVEMPAHVGVMILADIPSMTLNRPFVLSINNTHAKVAILDEAEFKDANLAALTVVQDMYQGMKTPYLVRPLKSKPMDARALWYEVCTMSGAKLSLPYFDAKFPPHLRYLEHNALLARISKELTDAVVASWIALHQKLDAARDAKGNVSPARVKAEIQQHTANFDKARQAALDRLTNEREPLIEEINKDIDTNERRILKTKGVKIHPTDRRVLPFEFAAAKYHRELEKALQSRDLSAIRPANFFPEDDFAAEVR